MAICYCIICKKEFDVRPARIKKGQVKYCSRICQGISYKTQLKGKNNPFYGKKHSKNTIEKMSICKKDKPCDFIKTKFYKGEERITGKNHYYWKGGKYYHSSGYICEQSKSHPFCDKNGYVLQHRLIVEKSIFRFLTRIEVVHHINKIKDDNRIENLMVFINESAHQRFHINPNLVRKKEIIFNGSITSSPQIRPVLK